MKMRALAQAEAEKKLPGRESLRMVEAVQAIEPKKSYEKRLATAKTLRRLCFTAAFVVIASPAFGQTMEHAREVNSAPFSPDCRWIVTTSKDYTARLWDATTGLAMGQSMQHHGSVVSARFSPDGRPGGNRLRGQYSAAVGCDHGPSHGPAHAARRPGGFGVVRSGQQTGW
jgi:hypothetical protein